jgi:hypothetical protein
MWLTSGSDAREDRRWVLRWIALVLGAVVVATVAVTADRGGALVYRHGVAVTAGEAAADTVVASMRVPAAHAAVVHRDDGGLDWEPLPADYAVLSGIVEVSALPGVLAPDTSGAATGTGLALQVDGRAFLLLPGSFGDVRVQADLDLAHFSGTAGVVHHYQDSATYETFQVTGPTCGLVSYSGGKAKVLEEGTGLDSLQAAMISVSSAGEHIKGYVDERTAAHAHMEAPPPGRTGLFLDGRGVVVIQSMHVEPLAGEE